MKTVHLFDPITRAYLHSYDAQESPLEPGEYIVPDNSLGSTPDFQSGTWPLEQNGVWINTPDHRGTVWDTQTGHSVAWSELGALPAHLSAIAKPDDHSVWEGNQWAPNLNSLRAAKLTVLKSACASAILAGKQCNALGSNHVYPTTKDDQAFLTARYSKAVALGAAGAPYKFMCADQNGVWARRDHTAEQIIAVALAVESHITSTLDHLDTKLADVIAAGDDVAAIEAVVW